MKPRLTDYADELRLIQAAAKEDGVTLNFFTGTWGAREVAYFLGLEYETVRHRRAGLADIPVMRFGASSSATRTKLMLRWKPADVIAHRERLYEEGERRTPRYHVLQFRKRTG